MNRFAFAILLAISFAGSCIPGELAFAQIGPNRPGPQGPAGPQGDPGASAYEVAVLNGFMGDESAWLASLEGTDGDPGIQGVPGVDGEDFGVDYLFESTVGTSNPGSGRLGLNNADHSLATTLVVSETDASAVNVAGWLGTLDDSTSATKGQLFVRQATDPTVYRIFSVTGVVDSGSFWTLAIDLSSQNGTLADDDGLKLAFLSTGDKGEAGETGPTGPQGETGETGVAGEDGRTWHSGTDPPADGVGENGDFFLDTEDDAYYGPKAGGTWTGTGPTSLIGPTGPAGSPGTNGSDGSDGSDGKTWYSGTTAPNDSIGVNGDYYLDTETHAYYGPKAGGTWAGTGPTSLIGPTGPTGATGSAGADGKTWHSGSGAPGDGTGVNGDFYIDTAAGAYYGPKAGGTWSGTGPHSLVGPTGATGAAGADGKTVLNGTADPTTQGVNGDFYIKTSGTPSEWKIFGPKASGSWPAGVALQGPTGATGAQGDPGATGATGATGRDAGVNYKFNTNTASGDPGTGKLKFDNATLSSATTLRIYEVDDDGANLEDWIPSWDDVAGNRLEIRKVGSPSTFAFFEIEPVSVVAGVYFEVLVNHEFGAGTFSNNDECMIFVHRRGAVGATGSTGSTGAAGRDAGWNFQWNTNTSTGDPGSGKLKFNNSTLSSATTLRISETDDDANGLAAIVATWDDVVSATRGYVTVHKVGTPGTFAEFSIASSLTDQGTYDEFTVSHVASRGTFSNNDETTVSFRPATVDLHYAQLRRDAAQSMAHNAVTAISWDATAFTSGLTVGSSGITLARDGTYRVEWSGSMALNAGNILLMRPLKNTASFGPDARIQVGGTSSHSVSGSFVFQGVAGDVISAGIFQNSGGAVNTPTSGELRPYLTVTEIR